MTENTNGMGKVLNLGHCNYPIYKGGKVDYSLTIMWICLLYYKGWQNSVLHAILEFSIRKELEGYGSLL